MIELDLTLVMIALNVHEMLSCLISANATVTCGDPEANMAELWSRIKIEFYSTNPALGRFTNIETGMFWKGSMTGSKVKFPKLKGKAYEVKVLMPALVWAWDQYRTVGDAAHSQIKVLLACSVHLDHLLDIHKEADVLPPDAAKEFMNAGFAVNTCMTSLLDLFSEEYGWSLFNITPKNHYLAHICLAAKYLNPRRAWCYAGEDMMRHVRRMGSQSARGVTADKIGKKLMTYYMHALGMSLCMKTNWWR